LFAAYLTLVVLMKLLALGIFIRIAYTQGPGSGISKDTRACSEGIIDSTYNFMLKYFPVAEAPDDCEARNCPCGRQARVVLKDSRILPPPVCGGTRQASTTTGFGLHCVYGAGTDDIRERESGVLSQEELEAIFVTKFGDMSRFDQFMFYGTGLYTPDIRGFMDGLDSGEENYFAFKWTSGSNVYISVLVTPPNTQLLYEVIAPASTAPKSLIERAVEQDSHSFSFMYFEEFWEPEVRSGRMAALFVSRATTNITRDKLWFETVFGLSESNFVTYTGTDPNGNSYKALEVQMSRSFYTKYRLIQPDNVTDGDYSVKWWEDYLNGVNAEYMRSPTCGWPLTGDNHNGLDFLGFFDQEIIVGVMKNLNMSYFCKATSAVGFTGVTCYLTTPFGYQIQLDGAYSNPPTYYSYPDNLCPTYDEYC